MSVDAGTVAAATSAAYAADMAGEIYRNVYAINCRTKDNSKDLTDIGNLLATVSEGTMQGLSVIIDKLEKIAAENQALRQDVMTLKAQMNELAPEQRYTAMTR